MKLPINLAPHLPIRAKPTICDFWRNFVDPDIWSCVEGEDGFLRDIMGRSGNCGGLRVLGRHEKSRYKDCFWIGL